MCSPQSGGGEKRRDVHHLFASNKAELTLIIHLIRI